MDPRASGILGYVSALSLRYTNIYKEFHTYYHFINNFINPVSQLYKLRINVVKSLDCHGIPHFIIGSTTEVKMERFFTCPVQAGIQGIWEQNWEYP